MALTIKHVNVLQNYLLDKIKMRRNGKTDINAYSLVHYDKKRAPWRQ